MTGAPILGCGVWCPPEEAAAEAAAAEQQGFDEVWLGEDFFDSGGIAAAALALAATRRITVGLGVLSAAVRHPALLAMELSALGRAHPGRLIAGIGLGDPDPLGTIGALPESPLALIRDGVSTVRALLRGDRVAASGGDISLSFPAPVPAHVGAVGPRMLRLAGEVGEGTVLSTGAGPEYVAWARRRIAEGRGGDLAGHRLTVLSFASVAATTAAAQEAVRRPLARLLAKPVFGGLVRHSGLGEEAVAAAAAGPESLHAALVPEWLDAFVVAGDPWRCVERIGALQRAGADAVVLCPWGEAPDCAGLIRREVLPALRGGPAG